MLQFDRVNLPEETEAPRLEVRVFLTEEAAHIPQPNSDFTTGHDPLGQELCTRGADGLWDFLATSG